MANAISITQFLSTFLNSWPASFSWISALDRLAPAIAVRTQPVLSGSMCVSAISDSCVAAANLLNNSTTNAAKNEALYVTMNIAPAPQNIDNINPISRNLTLWENSAIAVVISGVYGCPVKLDITSGLRWSCSNCVIW